MTLTIIHKDTSFGPGDKIKVVQKIKEGEKNRLQIFEGMVIALSVETKIKVFPSEELVQDKSALKEFFRFTLPQLRK